ncbi:MFHAS1 [Branchiostoma lanceolatum]|uniref:MFHAS1 protein n=1 Tax=Branchiostoma lanceolatum TaxID=7740 RepID=A0A8J9Z3Z4_BRALA|nr:MFHAS1 [Branchiostoma lanceolatum]
METGPRVVLLHAAEDEEFVRRLVEKLMGLYGGYRLTQTDIFCQQVTGTPGDVSRAQLTSTLTLGSVKLVVPVISRHLLADHSSLTVGLETAVRNNKPRYVIWLDQNQDDFREFGTLVSRQYPTLEAPARRVQRDKVEETMPGNGAYRGVHGIAWDVRDALCKQTGELRFPCWRALRATRAFLADNMNLPAVLTRLEQENQLSPAEVRDIQAWPTPVSRGKRLVWMLMYDWRRQEPYDWLVRVLREEGQDFLVEEMEGLERLEERFYGIGEQQAAQPGQQTAQKEHFAQQSQAVSIQKHLRHRYPGAHADDATTSTVKAVFLGQTEAGKTSLLNCIIKGKGHVEIETDRTIGVDVITYHDTKNNVKYEMYDFGGHQIYHYTHRFFLTRQALHILNVDLPGYKSEEFQERVGTWLTSVTSHVFNPAILVVGTKIDLFPPDKAEEMIAAACSSIQRDIQVAESKMQTKLKEEIQLCQNAVEATHVGDLPDAFYGLTKNDILAKKESLEKLLDGRPKGLLNVQVIPVSSKTFQGIEALCNKMAEMVKDERLFPAARQELPTSWMKLSENIKTSGRTYLHVRDCQDVGAAAGMKESDVLNALSYLHVTGQILFYNHIRGMEDLVFPDPTIILTLFKQILRHDLPVYLDSIAESLSEHARVQFAEDRVSFFKTGRASDSFMKNLLGDNIATFNSLLPLIKHFGLCYSGSVIFPTKLPAAKPDVVARCWPEIVPSGGEEISVTIEYSQEPPLGLPETMVSRILSMEQTTRRLLTKDTVVVHVGENSEDVMYRHFPTREEIRIRGEPEKAWRQAQTVAKVIEACWDEFPALYFSNSVGSGETTRSLTIEAVRRHVPGDLLRMSEGNWERPVERPVIRTSEDVIGKYFIDNRLYQVSRAVGEEGQLWTRLGQELGLNRAVLNNIRREYNWDTQQAFQMLKAWLTKTPHGPLHYLPQLQETLQNIGKPDLAAAVQGVYKEYREALPIQEVSPEMTGDTEWSLRLPGEGKYLCRRTDLGVVTPYPLHVTYRSANWSDNWQQVGEWMPVGPLFSIQCEDVEGPVDILLPHVLHLADRTAAEPPEVANMRIVHVVGGEADLLPVSEITSTHVGTRFSKGSLFGPVMKKMVARFYPRNGLCVVFGPRNFMPECQIHVYIASNAMIALQTLQDLEALDDYIRWDQDQCVLQSGEAYRLEVSVRNGEEMKMPTNPEGLVFYDTLEKDKFYKKFRVEVDIRKVKSLKKNQPTFKMLLKNAAGTTVCEFITAKGQRLQIPDADSGESDSGLSSEPASTAFPGEEGQQPGIYFPDSGRQRAAGSAAHSDSGPSAGSAAHPRRKRRSSRTLVGGSASKGKGKKMKGDDQRGADVLSTTKRIGGSTERVSVLLVGDEFCTSKGGISTINLQVARMLTAAGAEVYATVLEATEQDERDAERDEVKLLKPRLDADSSAKPSLEWLTVYHKHHFPHIPPDVCCIVGHVDVTSRAARKIKEERFPHAKLAMFGHVAPEETEHYKSDEKALGVGRKEASIQEDIGKADVVFSVGARIHRHYDRFLRRNRVDHNIFLPEPSKVFREANVSFAEESKKVRKPERSVLSVGRVRDVEMLKGHDLAAGAIDKVAQRLDGQYTLRLRVRGIDENDFKESKRILEEKLKSGRVKPTLLPYGTQEDIRRDMENCHLVLMPSRAEPFGLVGLEAIAAGVPVLISEHSGLAELIEALSDRLGQPKFRHCIVKMTGDTATDGDAGKWADRIEDVLKNARSEFVEARAFREKLLASKYWEVSQQKFLQACGITADPSAEAEGEGAEADDSD